MHWLNTDGAAWGRRAKPSSRGLTYTDINNVKGYGDLPAYLAGQEVEVIASVPCYTAENVARQRGAGVFEKSISALRKLNGVGYGTRLPLNLVYNPVGPKLPAPQAELEADYKEVLGREFGIQFNHLYTITNQPIARFAEDLRRQGQAEEYMSLLAASFNPATVESLMCRMTLSVGWMGEVYDCDFNQMLGMQMQNGKPLYLWDVTPELLEGWAVRTGAHCLACTAGGAPGKVRKHWRRDRFQISIDVNRVADGRLNKPPPQTRNRQASTRRRP